MANNYELPVPLGFGHGRRPPFELGIRKLKLLGRGRSRFTGLITNPENDTLTTQEKSGRSDGGRQLTDEEVKRVVKARLAQDKEDVNSLFCVGTGITGLLQFEDIKPVKVHKYRPEEKKLDENYMYMYEYDNRPKECYNDPAVIGMHVVEGQGMRDEFERSEVTIDFLPPPTPKAKPSKGKTNGYCLFIKEVAKKNGCTGSLNELMMKFDCAWRALPDEEKVVWRQRAKTGWQPPRSERPSRRSMGTRNSSFGSQARENTNDDEENDEGYG